MAIKIGKGAAAPPFLVMDVIAAANARQAALAAGAPKKELAEDIREVETKLGPALTAWKAKLLTVEKAS